MELTTFECFDMLLSNKLLFICKNEEFAYLDLNHYLMLIFIKLSDNAGNVNTISKATGHTNIRELKSYDSGGQNEFRRMPNTVYPPGTNQSTSISFQNASTSNSVEKRYIYGMIHIFHGYIVNFYNISKKVKISIKQKYITYGTESSQLQ